MTFWFLSGDSPFALLRYLSFVDSITDFFQIQKQLSEQHIHNHENALNYIDDTKT